MMVAVASRNPQDSCRSLLPPSNSRWRHRTQRNNLVGRGAEGAVVQAVEEAEVEVVEAVVA